MKKLVDVSVLDTAESTMSNLAEIMDVNCQVSDTISGQQVGRSKTAAINLFGRNQRELLCAFKLFPVTNLIPYLYNI